MNKSYAVKFLIENPDVAQHAKFYTHTLAMPKWAEMLDELRGAEYMECGQLDHHCDYMVVESHCVAPFVKKAQPKYVIIRADVTYMFFEIED